MLKDATQWISRWGEIQPERDAVVERGRSTTWASFAEDTSRVANALRSTGVVPGDRVACLMRNRVEFLEAFFGTMRAGALFVPLNTRLAGPELEWILDNSQPKVIFSEAEFDALRPRSPAQRIWVNVDGSEFDESRDWGELLSEADPTFEESIVGMDAAASILYTSGTTGFPKGAVFTHDAFNHLMINAMLTIGIGREDKMMMCLPLCFGGGLAGLAYPALAMGQTMVLEAGFDKDRVTSLIESEQVTFMCGVPTIWMQIQEAVGDKPARLASLRRGTVGAAPVPTTLLRWFNENGVQVSQGYGLTEGGAAQLYLTNTDAERKLGSTGRAMATCEYRVVDDEGRDVGVGTTGELVVRGPTIMREYWMNPDASAEALRDGWLHTGDLATVDEDGFVTIVDRKKDMIISGGLNVYPAEVERVLHKIPDVAEAAVIGLPDAKWGEAVTAVLVLKDASTLTPEDVVVHCRKHLGGYKVPRRVEFVAEIPKTVSGKNLKRQLREDFADARIVAPS